MIGGGAVAWSLPARSQQPEKIAKIGYLDLGPASVRVDRVEALRAGLRDLGYEEIDSSFSTLTQKKVGGLVVENDPFFDSRRQRLIQLTAQRSLPAIYHIREFPIAGGLMSYGTNLVDAYNQMGVLVGRILKGANITDLPVTRPTKFELAINLSTAKALGLTIPPTVLATADELID